MQPHLPLLRCLTASSAAALALSVLVRKHKLGLLFSTAMDDGVSSQDKKTSPPPADSDRQQAALQGTWAGGGADHDHQAPTPGRQLMGFGKDRPAHPPPSAGILLLLICSC
ncbi:hypothetical protein SEVIR_5G471150v4 [Setaria viridis]